MTRSDVTLIAFRSIELIFRNVTTRMLIPVIRKWTEFRAQTFVHNKLVIMLPIHIFFLIRLLVLMCSVLFYFCFFFKSCRNRFVIAGNLLHRAMCPILFYYVFLSQVIKNYNFDLLLLYAFIVSNV